LHYDIKIERLTRDDHRLFQNEAVESGVAHCPDLFALRAGADVVFCVARFTCRHSLFDDVHTDAPIQHVRKDAHRHDHSDRYSHAGSDGDHHSASMALNAKPVPEKAPHSSDGQCCGLMCVTALPAMLIDIVKPSAPVALCEVEGYLKVTDNAPPRLYRPPIS
jgi:hypothetical protein